MDFSNESRVLHRCSAQVLDIGNLLLLSLWHLVHSIISICNVTLDIANVLESYLISSGLLGRYKSLHIAKLRYLAIVIESEEAYQTSKIIELLQWLEAVGVKHVCLYDKEGRSSGFSLSLGILKKSKDFILENLDGAILFQDAHENNVLLDQQHMTLEFVSFSDGKEAVAKAANVLFMKYSKSGVTDQNQKEKIFTESQMSEALKTVGLFLLSDQVGEL
ncbi:hypothetical protein Godav_005568 [Gossypium davidsonii]|uniref:ditrans,polycis-polyprenyl diphosphate synthase [(2E,6E)-farnesyldiphosphate specific] n=1 Tax=Gossypium davidsonii TaxID=34287 RepID=A0A7J8S0Z2_GOSDV|nr:hypothetical protein [Gossypium davidsonii]